MAAQIGCTMFFSDHACNQGWSETHYLVSAQDLVAAMKLAQPMAEARTMILGTGITCDYIRVSDANVKGDSQVLPGLPPATTAPINYNKELNANNTVSGEFTTISGVSDVPWTSLLVRMEMGTQQRKSLYLRGIPDVDDFDGKIIADTTFIKYFKLWQKVMLSGAWGARVLNKDPNANPAVNITGITNVAGPPATVTITAPNHKLQVGMMVRISGVKYQKPPAAASTPINGLWQVATVPDGNTFTLSGFNGSVQYFFGGTVRQRQYTVAAYTNVQQIRLTSHRPGRPFGLLRGRRKRYSAYH